MDRLNNSDINNARVIRGSGHNEASHLEGFYTLTCYDANGNLKWEDRIENTVVDVGKKHIMDTMFGTSAYTPTGPFMGLISSVGWTSVAAADTMASHSGWYECGVDGTHGPVVAARNSLNGSFSAASGTGTVTKALSSATSFTITALTGGSSVQGCFIVMASGAVATIGSTAGTLYSGGAFSGGAKTVAVNDVIQVSYSTTL